MTVEFGVLGEIWARQGEQVLDVGPARQRCVLAALLVDAGRVVSADRLVGRVWGEHAPPTARRTLSSYLARLRSAGVPVERQSGGYRLAVDPDSVDVHRFTRLVAEARAADDEAADRLFGAALELWQGDALSGMDVPWADEVRTSWHGQRFAAELDHVDVRLRLRHGGEVLPVVQALAAAHPLDERVAGQLISVLHQAGRTADALAAYQDFRSRLIEELGVDPGPALREAHQRILAGSPDAGVPRQLPARPGMFTGRTEQLMTLDRSPGTAVISAIGGGGGVGKTWLALHWSYANIDRFPDGQLYVDLRGFDPGADPTAPSTALRGFLGALGVAPESAPSELDDQAALYRSLVAGKRMLVVLDNAADTDQVTPLLPGGQSCTVLVTSRRTLSGLIVRHGALSVQLDVLSPAESRALLVAHLGAHRVEAEPEAVARIVRLCAGLPLALGIVAGRAMVRTGLAWVADQLGADRLDELETDDPGLSLRSVLSWSYRGLSADAVTLIGLLALAPGGDTGLDAVRSLSPVPPRAALAELEAANLVSWTADGRCRMHDLVRLYAAERAAADLSPDVRTAALRRVVDFYLHTAYSAERLLFPHRPPRPPASAADGTQPRGFEDAAPALVWIAAEHACLLSAQLLAEGRGWHDSVWQLAWTMDTFHYRYGLMDVERRTWQRGLAASQALGNVEIQALARRTLGDCCARLGHHDEALEHLEHALVLAQELGDPGTMAATHRALAVTWDQRRDDERALPHAMRSLELFREAGNLAREADALAAVGWHLARVGRFDEGRRSVEAGLALARKQQFDLAQSSALENLGYIAFHTGQYAEAVAHYREALAMWRSLGHLPEAADVLISLADCHVALGEDAEARECWEAALPMLVRQQRSVLADQLRERLAGSDPSA